MKRWSFNLQIYFLNTRYRQIIDIQKGGHNIIQDRTIYEDAYIFAENLHDMGLMTTRDYQNYQAIFDNITEFIKPPDLLIYLRASVPTLVNNIQRRGREYETGIRLDYLSKLNEKYQKWINSYKLGKLLIIDKDNRPRWNPATIETIDPEDIEAYFAPLPEGELSFARQ